MSVPILDAGSGSCDTSTGAFASLGQQASQQNLTRHVDGDVVSAWLLPILMQEAGLAVICADSGCRLRQLRHLHRREATLTTQVHRLRLALVAPGCTQTLR